MKWLIALTLLVLPASSGCWAKTDEQPFAGDVLIAAQLASALGGEQRDDQNFVYISLRPAMQDSVFKQLSPSKQHQVASLYGAAAERIGHSGEAHDAFVRVTSGSMATDDDWLARMDLAIQAKDGEDAFASFRYLTDRHVRLLGVLGSRRLTSLDQLVGQLPNAIDARLAIGQEMEQEDWRPERIFDDASFYWLPYIEALIERGQEFKALAISSRITDPIIMVAMQADRRFDRIIASDPARFDPEAAAERQLSWAQELSKRSPGQIGPRIATEQALTLLNRPEESFALVDSAASAIMHESSDERAFLDPGYAYAVFDARDELLVLTGRTDEAIGAATAVAQRTRAPFAVYAAGRLLMQAGRGEEALTWLRGARCDCLNLYEHASLAQATACADAQVGDDADLRKQLAFLAAHESWNRGALVGGLVCANRLDAAAEVLKRQLADPHSRLAALLRLQGFAEFKRTPKYGQILDRRWETLRSNPELRAAIAKVGRTRDYRLTGLFPEI